MVQEMKGETENTSQYVSDMCRHVIPTGASLQSETLDPKLKNLTSFENEYMPKVRKPYTITKQREKWTEEEHQKFLEALKLYGRAWRHIEEHIGTKTAVQIRSHAQKFFSKVARDSNSVSAGSHVPIEIPPPRPKKKPLHPYPRKVADFLMNRSVVSDQPERSLSTDVSLNDVENLSPTSVLPTIGSDPISPAISELNTHCLSPIPCTSTPPSGNTSTEKDHGCLTPNSCATEKILSSSIEKIPSSMPDNLSPSSSIKLFGKMVLITDSRKPSTLTEECNDFFSNRSREDKFVYQNRRLPTDDKECQVSYEMLYSSSQTCANLSETKGSINEDKRHADAVSRTLSWWSSCKSSPLRAADLSLEQRLVDEENGDLGSLCSSSGSVNRVYGIQMHPGAHGSQYRTNIQPRRNTRGFVPYKRCAEEIDSMSLVNVFEESEAKKIRACS